MRCLTLRLVLPLLVSLSTCMTSKAQAVTHVCGNATLNSVYGYVMTGQIFTSAAGFVPFADSGSLTWDGSGKFTGSSTLNEDGSVTTRTLSGSYTVN